MFIGSHEWRPVSHTSSPAHPLAAAPHIDQAALYRRLADGQPDTAARAQAAEFLRRELALAAVQPHELPEVPEDLGLWMAASTQRVHAKYGQYLEQRKAGAPRRFFISRAHALYFLRAAAPTKLVDGAWLYGLLAHAGNPRFSDLVRTYVEELGAGEADKNHVALYRALLAQHGLDPLDDLPDALYRQGLIQLALGWNAQEFLPEIIGFNLAYEQLPLHLLITAYELNELGLDPYYFTLHVTVDNCDTGHARRACQAVLDTLPRLDDGGVFWRRMREGGKLACAGLGTTQLIEGFDIDAEVLRILTRKAGTGSGAHSDYCRVAGRSVNHWLSAPDTMPAFLHALQHAGWIKRGEPAANSRFWKLLQGERAEMFGVFSGYELQVIYDWIRGDASVDGQPYSLSGETGEPHRRPTYRALQRRAGMEAGASATGQAQVLDPDLSVLKEQLSTLDAAAGEALLVQAMSPAQHWTPAGLYATRVFCQGAQG